MVALVGCTLSSRNALRFGACRSSNRLRLLGGLSLSRHFGLASERGFPSLRS